MTDWLTTSIPLRFRPKNPRLTGFDIEYEDGKTVPHIFRINTLEAEVWRACIAWHRTAFLPLLPDDCAYPEGELPRRMNPDEVRNQDGRALKITWNVAGTMQVGPYTINRRPTGCGDDKCKCLHNVPGQLARLQAFWDAHQKPASGPPVELAEDECLINSNRYTMGIVGGELHLLFEGKYGPYTYDGAQLRKLAAKHPDPLGWPRALAYFDRHVAKPEPARVTDVRFVDVAQEVFFETTGGTRCYAGKWEWAHEKHLHPSDIALIERCWAEGKLGEREVLFDDNAAGTVSLDEGHYGALIQHPGNRLPYTITAHMLKSDHDHWFRIGLQDPKQIARVRAIVARLQQDSRASQEVGAQPGDAQESAVGAALPIDRDAHMQEAAVVTEAHSVTPSGEPVDEKAQAILAWFDDEAHDGPGFYYYDENYPDEGAVGAFKRIEEARAHAESGDYLTTNPSWAVTPSGEVKAPFGQFFDPSDEGLYPRWVIGPLEVTYDADDGTVSCGIYGDDGEDLPRRLLEGKLRTLHAALSDHIRRGDAPIDWERKYYKAESQLTMCRQELREATDALEPAPDLTELREAWNSYMPGLAPLPDRVLPILLAVERLVK